MCNKNLQAIMNSYGRVVYSHKTHEKDAELAYKRVSRIKWINIVLTTIVASGLISIVFTNHLLVIYVSGVVSALTVGFMIFQLNFSPENKATQHKQAAKELWYIREKYIYLISDIMNDNLSAEKITQKRDNLASKLSIIYKFAPDTSPKAYEMTRKALKINEEMSFTSEEIDQFLPENLRVTEK